MFFYASKILWWLVTPSNVLVGLVVLGVLAQATRFARAGRRAIALAAAGLVLAGPVPLGIWLARPLENRFPQMAQDMPAPAGIIVLGGSVDQTTTAARGGQVTLAAAPGRITEAVALARRYPEARLVFTGGASAVFLRDGLDEAAAARKLFIELGIAADRIVIERESRNTWENAVFTRRLVQPKPGERWVMITSAWHMPRSVGIFRVAGFDVTPYPVDYETRGSASELVLPMLPASRGLDLVDRVVREWIGLVAYRLAGRTDALLPRP